tara:strand:- start:4057 stop:4953 length:897 start_codon:yes stop_codon:yes gene_type:complete
MQLKKILLFGKDGQVGRALCEALANKYQLVAVGKNELNLENIKLINQIIEDVNPDYLINAAAYTKVDQAEDENLLAVSINKVATEVMAKKTNSLGIPMIFYSTDYIFDGSNSSPYKEDDKPNPISFYGSTKLQGENVVRENNPKHIILRTSWVFSPHGNNFVKTIVKLSKSKSALNVVSDQQGCPTSSRWIADSTSKILNKLQEKKCYGTYNVVCDGVTNWFTFAQNILLMLEKKSYEKKLEFNQLTPIKSDKYPSKAKRPKNSVLSYQKLKSLLDINPPSWKNELNLVVDRIILMEN